MVYHEPGTRPWGNNPCLGPLRIFTSDEKAAQLVQSTIKDVVRFVLYGYGIALLLEKFVPKVEIIMEDSSIFRSVFFGAFVSMFTGFTTIIVTRIFAFLFNTEDIIKFLENPVPCCDVGKYVVTVYALMIVLKVITMVKAMYCAWKAGMATTPKSQLPEKFFWESTMYGKPPADYGDKQKGGVLFDTVTQKWMPLPQENPAHAFGGMSWLSFLYTNLTVGLEYPATALCRICKHYWWFPAWNTDYGNDCENRKLFYQGVINTSMACWIIDKDTTSVKRHRPELAQYHGAAVLDNVAMQFKSISVRHFDRMIICLDHKNQTFEKMILQWKGPAGKQMEEIWGSRNCAENARPDLNLTELESVAEAAKVAAATIVYYCHSHSHLWSNAMVLEDPQKWAVQPTSNEISQFIGALAGQLAITYSGDTTEIMMGIMMGNVANGLPYHSHGKIMQEVAKHSKFQQMSAIARAKIIQHMEATPPAWAPDPSSPHNVEAVDTIIASTIMHCAEHHYIVKYFPLEGNAIALETDLSGIMLGVSAPIAYWTRSFLVRQHLKDPICKILYSACVDIDAEFANNALSVGCAY